MSANLDREGTSPAEVAIRQFESELYAGREPDIVQFLPPSADHRAVALRALACIELTHRLETGKTARAEDYFRRYPELGAADPALDLIAAEYEFRCRIDRELSPDSFAQRFGQYGQRLVERLKQARTARASANAGSSYAGQTIQPVARSDWGRDTSPAADMGNSAAGLELGFDTFDDYKLLRCIGGGGMGVVYQAVHQRLGKQVAIKFLRPQLTSDPQALSRFEREMQAVGRLDHTNIVRATDAGETNGLRYLVMEFVDGETLGDLCRALGPLPVPEACEMARQAAVALAEVHLAGLVHRDIKPSNLMLNHRGEVKLLDLGLARLQQGAGAMGRETASGAVMGTPDYMAPEQLEHSRTVDIRADIYSLGSTLYELLSGKPPFPTPQYDTLPKKLLAIMTQPITPIEAQRPDTPAPLVAIVSRMLARQPADRFQTPAEVVAALAPLGAGANLEALFHRGRATGKRSRPGVSPRDSSHRQHAEAGDTYPARQFRDTPRMEVSRGRSWRLRQWAIVIGLLLACIGAVSILWIGRGEPRPKPVDTVVEKPKNEPKPESPGSVPTPTLVSHVPDKPPPVQQPVPIPSDKSTPPLNSALQGKPASQSVDPGSNSAPPPEQNEPTQQNPKPSQQQAEPAPQNSGPSQQQVEPVPRNVAPGQQQGAANTPRPLPAGPIQIVLDTFYVDAVTDKYPRDEIKFEIVVDGQALVINHPHKKSDGRTCRRFNSEEKWTMNQPLKFKRSIEFRAVELNSLLDDSKVVDLVIDAKTYQAGKTQFASQFLGGKYRLTWRWPE